MRDPGYIVTSTEIQTTGAVLTRAGRWFLHSGIQQPGGGVARFYRPDICKNALVSTEITGYASSFLFYLYRERGSPEYREAGLRAANFLARTAWDDSLGIFPFEHPVEHRGNGTAPEALTYFFDSGIIVRGLLSAWRATHESEFLEKALRAGRGMLTHFRGADAIHPILTLPDRQPRPYEPRWSASPGCYQLKSALAWHDLWEAAGDRQMLEAYETALEQALSTESNFLSGERDSAKIMDRLHAYLYFLEGLLPRADRPACARALALGIAKVAWHLNKIAPSFARSDVYAQLLRIRLFTGTLDVAPLDRAAAAKEAEAAAAFQLESDDARIGGGFGFGTKDGGMMPFVNPVSTAFCAQALAWWARYQSNSFRASHRELV